MDIENMSNKIDELIKKNEKRKELEREKLVDIRIIQVPVEVEFHCPYCTSEVSVNYDMFEDISNSDLSGLLYGNPTFICSNCGVDLKVDNVEID